MVQSSHTFQSFDLDPFLLVRLSVAKEHERGRWLDTHVRAVTQVYYSKKFFVRDEKWNAPFN